MTVGDFVALSSRWAASARVVSASGTRFSWKTRQGLGVCVARSSNGRPGVDVGPGGPGRSMRCGRTVDSECHANSDRPADFW